MIIIPDTHGLDFWKDAVSKRQDNEKNNLSRRLS